MMNTNWVMKLIGYQKPCLILFLRNQSDTRDQLHITFLCFIGEILLIYMCFPYFNAKIKKYTAFQKKKYTRIHRLLKELGSLSNNLIMLELWKRKLCKFWNFPLRIVKTFLKSGIWPKVSHTGQNSLIR